MIQTAQLDLAIAHTYREGRLGIHRRAIHYSTVAHAEARTMPWAGNSPILVCTLIQGSAQVRARRADGIDGVALLQQDCRDTRHIDTRELSLGQVLRVH